MGRRCELLHLPIELVQRITDHLPLQDRVEFHLLCKALYAALRVHIPPADTLKGHAHAMLLLMVKEDILAPRDDETDWRVVLRIETRQPYQVVYIARQSRGIMCVRTDIGDDLRFLTEELLFRKLAMCRDVVYGACLSITEQQRLRAWQLQHLAYNMTMILSKVQDRDTGQLTVLTNPECDALCIRKLFCVKRFFFDSFALFIDSRNAPTHPMSSLMPNMYGNFPSTACALSLSISEDMYTPFL